MRPRTSRRRPGARPSTPPSPFSIAMWRPLRVVRFRPADGGTRGSVVRVTYTDVMTTTTVLDLAQPLRAAAAVDALNDRLATEDGVAPEVAAGVAALADAVRATPLDRWTAADPYLALLVHRAVLDARAAADDRARDALRIALERLSHALAALGEAEEVGDARSPKELARWLAGAVEVPQRDLAALLGVDLRRFQRWISARERTQPEGEEARRMRALARDRRAAAPRVHARRRRRLVRLAAARARRRDPARAARRSRPAARAAAGGGLDAEHGVRVTVAYRLASWRRPLRTEPSRVAGRFHRMTEESPTQYLCLHPLGPWAEFLRAVGAAHPRAARPGAPSHLGAARGPRRAAADRLRRGGASTGCGPATSSPTTCARATGWPTGCAPAGAPARSCRAPRCPGRTTSSCSASARPRLTSSSRSAPSTSRPRSPPTAAARRSACSSASAAAATRTRPRGLARRRAATGSRSRAGRSGPWP